MDFEAEAAGEWEKRVGGGGGGWIEQCTVFVAYGISGILVLGHERTDESVGPAGTGGTVDEECPYRSHRRGERRSEADGGSG